MKPDDAIRAMADALGRHTYRHFTGLAVDLEPVGQITHERARKIALCASRLGRMEARGKVAVFPARDGSVAGWVVRKQREG